MKQTNLIMENTMDYKSLIKEMRQFGSLKRIALHYPGGLFLAHWLAPFLSAFAVKRGIRPNQLTRYMIPTAIFASILFAIPNIWVKILGAIGMHMFYLFDLADGQVARATKDFSTYGEQLDHIAHHCSHVFLLVSMIISIIQLNRYPITEIIALGGCMLFAEYAFRNICSITTEIQLIDKYEGKTEKDTHVENTILVKLIGKIKLLIFMFRCADNYVLFACVLFFADWFLGTDIVLILSYVYVGSSLLRNIHEVALLMKHVGKAERKE